MINEHEVIHLVLDDGNELECKMLGIFQVEEKEYIALLPNELEDVYIYGYEEKDNEPVLSHIESDEEYEKVSKAFLDLCDGEEEVQ
ncbi:DUF1292 domain-containing protein [Abyssisolibacter fermentans]|uniref:DUF1292 domain-containing protein n=1 Tax=Abyssisolibacter fermentans TaxID=1766203 RepID=UPI001FA7E6C0|nr:DUF1292 domain-containing protein [Abyssisolibacter fermentans]